MTEKYRKLNQDIAEIKANKYPEVEIKVFFYPQFGDGGGWTLRFERQTEGCESCDLEGIVVWRDEILFIQEILSKYGKYCFCPKGWDYGDEGEVYKMNPALQNIRGFTQEDGSINVQIWTNDDKDLGYPNDEASWESTCKDRGDFIKRYGKCRIGVSGVEVTVILDGKKIL